MSPTGCRFRRNWSGARCGWRSLQKPVRQSKPAPKDRFEREQAEHLAKLAARDAKTEATGKKPRGKPPQSPVAGPLPTDQVNLTDGESRIMPVAGGEFEQCYNAQAVVAEGSLLVVAADVVQAANDKQQLQPMLNKIAALPEVLGQAETLLAD